MKKLAILAILVLNSIMLSGCLPPAIQAASTINSIIAVNNDRRSSGEILDDKIIALNLFTWSEEDKKLTDAHLNFMVYNKTVLIVGEVPNGETLSYARDRIKQQVTGIKRIFSEVTVGSNSGLLSRAKDSTITLQVEALFQNQEVFHPTHVRVMTEAQTVYLMGAVTKREADKASKVASKAKGTHRVVKLFDHLTTRPAKEIERDRQRKIAEESKSQLDRKKAQLISEKARIQQQINELNGTTGTTF